MRANQLRLWFASMSYLLLFALRRIGLVHTQFVQATCGTIRVKPLKIAALVRCQCTAGEDRDRLVARISPLGWLAEAGSDRRVGSS
jgi:hypothetical protein